MTDRTARIGRRGVRDVYSPEALFVLGGIAQQVPFSRVARVDLELVSQVREFKSWQHKRNYSGFYWSSTTRSHVGFESFEERAALMCLDRDPSVVGISAQPLQIFWPRGHDPRDHVPDYFVRHASGDGELVDVRPRGRLDEVAERSFLATRGLCEIAGLRYRVISDLSAAFDRNLRFLSRYRRSQFDLGVEQVAVLGPLAGCSTSVGGLVEAMAAGGAARQVAFGWVARAIWDLRVRVDLDVILGMGSAAIVAEGDAR